jgi:hypothetical protein
LKLPTSMQILTLIFKKLENEWYVFLQTILNS